MKRAVVLVVVSLFNMLYAVENSSAMKMIKDDLLPEVKKYAMPSNCVTTNREAIERGKYLYHNADGKSAKSKPPRGLSRKYANGKTKLYGNCIACHNIEGAIGGGSVGPDLTSYKEYFVDTGVRNAQFVFQKIADARVDDPNSFMTINLTSKMFNEREICDITSYLLATKKK